MNQIYTKRILYNTTYKSLLLDLCEGTDGWSVYDPMLTPRQLRFSLYSGAVITEGQV